MAEAENIGYKRTKRGEKEMPNDLFELEYAPDVLDVSAIRKKYGDIKASINSAIKKEEDKKKKEKKSDKLAAIDEKINGLKEELENIESEEKTIEDFISKYYNGDKLRDEFSERTDDDLIRMFKDGVLSNFQSTRIALHKSTHRTILDYMRELNWE